MLLSDEIKFICDRGEMWEQPVTLCTQYVHVTHNVASANIVDDPYGLRIKSSFSIQTCKIVEASPLQNSTVLPVVR